ncbi:hypothetical protein AVEN_107153-1 [Araneus ventricosus]|uniref:Uncharacterized protein n=1 Tax=Araneus ventricosus TaxID=182803 RepID=A0A4Y2I4U8_ARAVE|nr:hypothetical protein AVEN_107153-1 [Araneus ventricosus]
MKPATINVQKQYDVQFLLWLGLEYEKSETAIGTLEQGEAEEKEFFALRLTLLLLQLFDMRFTLTSLDYKFGNKRLSGSSPENSKAGKSSACF